MVATACSLPGRACQRERYPDLTLCDRGEQRAWPLEVASYGFRAGGIGKQLERIG